MTKSQEQGENEVTTEARRIAAETGKDVCAVLSAMLRSAKGQEDKSRVKKIERAQKYLGCRNVRKRKGG